MVQRCDESYSSSQVAGDAIGGEGGSRGSPQLVLVRTDWYNKGERRRSRSSCCIILPFCLVSLSRTEQRVGIVFGQISHGLELQLLSPAHLDAIHAIHALFALSFTT